MNNEHELLKSCKCLLHVMKLQLHVGIDIMILPEALQFYPH